jgi:hypothetical protein
MTTSDKMWVISGESGEYSDTTWWVVSVVETKDDGEAIIKDLEAEVTRIASMRPVSYYENGDAPKRREPTLLARVDPWGAGRWPSYSYDTKPIRYSLTEVDVVTLAKLRGQP